MQKVNLELEIDDGLTVDEIYELQKFVKTCLQEKLDEIYARRPSAPVLQIKKKELN